MPNITTSMYMTDEEYSEYFLPNKKRILQVMRETVRKELGLRQRGDSNENKNE